MTKKTTNFAEVIRKKLADNPHIAQKVDEESSNAQIAIEIYEARKEAGLTQKQLGDLIDSHQSVIARLEDADYQGHSVSMLQKIAAALNKRLRIEFCGPHNFVVPQQALSLDEPAWSDSAWDVEVSASVHDENVRVA